MRTEEDEAFDELARKQGAWGGGFKAKQAMAADKLWDKPSVAFDEWWNGDNDESTNPFRLESGAYWAWAGWKAALAQPVQEDSCFCHSGVSLQSVSGGAAPEGYLGRVTLLIDGEYVDYVKAQPVQQEAIYGMNQDDWKDVVAVISKVRDGRGIYLGCRPADVFQEWFLALGTAKVPALGTAKVKEKNND